MWRGGAKAWRSRSNGGVCGRSWMGCFTVYSVTAPGGMSHRIPVTAPAALRARPGGHGNKRSPGLAVHGSGRFCGSALQRR